MTRGSGTIQLLCHVKPGVSANREGIAAVSDERIEVCVAAQARDGEANKAVREIIADVLRVPKSDVEVVKGMKSRDKMVAVTNISTNRKPEEEIVRTRELLADSIGR
ncbi:YggU-like protein [Dothidotthia symphoricarpi CBS 119687]|uniref:YggU-like protein n=1 Tax=Dothidotthia symphoricarpi CBS 119687 TaxID=1392245 RepID=A0A6A6ARL9_9PLEO|nr:YggU-like protein [Dothidotthia symphoricarpi CBS 119687]KAF2134460.1 YggU-like protein [Dothidotthia symphoricarpi CBS 119687]